MTSLPFSVALWAVNLANPVASMDEWLARVAAQMRTAAAAGADVLVMPEYACEQWLDFAPGGLREDEEIPWLGERTSTTLPSLARLVRETDMGLLPGTMPHRAPGGGWTNRAHLLLPTGDGGLHTAQDKLCLTPFETETGAWMLTPGSEFRVTEWRGLRIGTLICLDIELPALSARLAPLGLDIVLVPSMTEREAGYWRVFGCAKARAIELQAIVCAVGAVGPFRTGGRVETNVSGAAVYVPCEPRLGHNGILATAGPMAESTEPLGPMLVARHLPVEVVRALRAGEAEVWPGGWRADGVRIPHERLE